MQTVDDFIERHLHLDVGPVHTPEPPDSTPWGEDPGWGELLYQIHLLTEEARGPSQWPLTTRMTVVLREFETLETFPQTNATEEELPQLLKEILEKNAEPAECEIGMAIVCYGYLPWNRGYEVASRWGLVEMVGNAFGADFHFLSADMLLFGMGEITRREETNQSAILERSVEMLDFGWKMTEALKTTDGLKRFERHFNERGTGRLFYFQQMYKTKLRRAFENLMEGLCAGVKEEETAGEIIAVLKRMAVGGSGETMESVSVCANILAHRIGWGSGIKGAMEMVKGFMGDSGSTNLTLRNGLDAMMEVVRRGRMEMWEVFTKELYERMTEGKTERAFGEVGLIRDFGELIRRDEKAAMVFVESRMFGFFKELMEGNAFALAMESTETIYSLLDMHNPEITQRVLESGVLRHADLVLHGGDRGGLVRLASLVQRAELREDYRVLEMLREEESLMEALERLGNDGDKVAEDLFLTLQETLI